MTAAAKTKACPRCGKEAGAFHPVDTGLKVALQSTGMAESLPSQVCSNCYNELTANVSQGVKLRIEKEAKEKNKMMMWKNRVNLIKQARNLMIQKAFSEAAVSYEKYIRVLEMVYNLKKGELSPTIFNNSSRSKELTVIASVYWDLVRIYDTSPRYGDRMVKAAQKLAAFLPYSPIYPDVAKKAEGFLRSAKNPQVIRGLLRDLKVTKGGCFIATAIMASDPWAPEVMTLRRFRDQVLRSHPQGRAAIALYYQLSPPIAQFIRKRPGLQKVLQPWLKKFSQKVHKVLEKPT